MQISRLFHLPWTCLLRADWKPIDRSLARLWSSQVRRQCIIAKSAKILLILLHIHNIFKAFLFIPKLEWKNREKKWTKNNPEYIKEKRKEENCYCIEIGIVHQSCIYAKLHFSQFSPFFSIVSVFCKEVCFLLFSISFLFSSCTW